MIACYMRLSIADREHDKTLPADAESNSIQGQRIFLESFIANETSLYGKEVRYFADDGFSGTNSERPALQEMLDGCRDGLVDTVIVKDFSRLARDYVDAGNMVESLFPFLGVRFIAVMEGYDSAAISNSVEDNFIMGFKNIINAGYSHSVSQSVKSGFQAHWTKGEHVQGIAPFGYIYDKEARGNLRIDPVAERYVKRIFELAIEGNGTQATADIANEEGIPVPSAYAEKNGNQLSGITVKRKWTTWTCNKVRHVLQNVAYKGDLAARKSIATGVGTKKKRGASPDEIVYYANAHDAIVSPEDWEQANKVIKTKNRKPVNKPVDGLFTGIIVCAQCGKPPKTLRKNRVVTGYVVNCTCGCDATISESELEEVVRASLAAHLQASGIAEKAAAAMRSKEKREISGIDRELEGIEGQCKRLKQVKLQAYEKLTTGKLDESGYRTEKDRIDSSLYEIAAHECALKDKRNAIEASQRAARRADSMVTRLRELDLGTALNRDDILQFVKQVKLYSDGSVSVQYMFDDFMAEGAIPCS